MFRTDPYPDSNKSLNLDPDSDKTLNPDPDLTSFQNLGPDPDYELI